MVLNVSKLLSITTWLFIRMISCTIDLNSPELQYLADHLTKEECRKLIAAVHFKGFEEPKILDQAERTITKDMSCIELLHHWNSEKGEGKGETHELLEHRLRQIGKIELADWLGKTVFHELGRDLNDSIENGLRDFVTETTEGTFLAGPTLVPVVENGDPTEWSPIDTILYVFIVILIIIISAVCFKVCCETLLKCRRKREIKLKKAKNYNIIDETSGSESEDKFDVRRYTDKINITSSETEN